MFDVSCKGKLPLLIILQPWGCKNKLPHLKERNFEFNTERTILITVLHPIGINKEKEDRQKNLRYLHFFACPGYQMSLS
jgi:hypothetical protein